MLSEHITCFASELEFRPLRIFLCQPTSLVTQIFSFRSVLFDRQHRYIIIILLIINFFLLCCGYFPVTMYSRIWFRIHRFIFKIGVCICVCACALRRRQDTSERFKEIINLFSVSLEVIWIFIVDRISIRAVLLVLIRFIRKCDSRVICDRKFAAKAVVEKCLFKYRYIQFFFFFSWIY